MGLPKWRELANKMLDQTIDNQGKMCLIYSLGSVYIQTDTYHGQFSTKHT